MFPLRTDDLMINTLSNKELLLKRKLMSVEKLKALRITWQSNTKHYNFFQNIIKFVYETNNTFVTWNTHINLKNGYNFIS